MKKALFSTGALALLLPTQIAASSQCTGAAAAGAPCGDNSLINAIQNNIVNTLFFVIGALAVIIMLVGAIRYITSTGDAKRIQQAKDTILYALLGLIVAILARAIVGFVIGRLT